MQRREPALRSSRAERVAADLEHEILSARLPVGAHLGRRSEIMDRFGISPTVMNETLRILRDRDLVTVRPGPGGGITVASAPQRLVHHRRADAEPVHDLRTATQVSPDRQAGAEDLVLQIGGDALSARRPQRGLATLHAGLLRILGAAVAPQRKFPGRNRCG